MKALQKLVLNFQILYHQVFLDLLTLDTNIELPGNILGVTCISSIIYLILDITDTCI